MGLLLLKHSERSEGCLLLPVISGITRGFLAASLRSDLFEKEKLFKFVALLVAALLVSSQLCHADDLDTLAADYWQWRAAEQPLSLDDMTRLERPPDWAPDWSPAAVAKYRGELSGLEARWKRINPAPMPVARQVDWRLIGSALARARWELDTLRSWQRNPMFY